jgi:myo-inositol-1(or 4)-monophosphatase
MITQQMRDVVIKAVLDGGKILRDNIDNLKEIKEKTSSRDIVTNIDLEVEKLLIEAIQSNFPGHEILSEEAGFIAGNSEFEWVIDPLDGSMNYAHTHPPFRIGICLLKGGQPIFSVLYGPTRDHLYIAEKGKGATMNDHPIHVSKNDNLKDSIFMTHLSSNKLARLRTIISLEKVYTQTAHARMLGSGLASMCYVAEGRYDVFYNLVTKPWDILPGSLLIEEAGGKVTDVEGKPITLESTSVLATNGHLHDSMLQLLVDV